MQNVGGLFCRRQCSDCPGLSGFGGRAWTRPGEVLVLRGVGAVCGAAACPQREEKSFPRFGVWLKHVDQLTYRSTYLS